MPWSSSIVPSEILAVHAALVPNGPAGEVVLFGGDEHWSAQQEPGGDFRKTRVYDVATHALVAAAIPSPDSDVFCAHHVFAKDGRLLIGGGTQKWPEGGDVHGHALDFLGHRRCWIYNHARRTWSEVARFNPNPDTPDEPHSGGRWYPGLYTLGNGDVLAVFGHPDQQDSRHRNNLPERFSQGGNFWANLPKTVGTFGEPQSGGRRFLFFPRGWTMPDGKLFFATPMPADFSGGTEGAHSSTAFDPSLGDYVAPKVTQPSGSAYNDWDRPAVVLPLLPSEGYRMRMLHVGSTSPVRLDLGDATPAWTATAARHASVAGRDRRFSNAVLLPTGQVCVVGGVHVTDPEDPVLEAELYEPGIDWTAGDYSAAQTWSVDGSSTHARNYHSTALLLPNGKVWVAGGNTNASSGDPDGDVSVGGVTKKRAIKHIELYEPVYVDVANRIRVTTAPRVLGYGQSFSVTIDRAATNVRNVALIRNGSVTHSTNNDQRFVGLTIDARSGNTLTLSAPPSGNVAPPGHYMLWVVDNAGNPCVLAPFVRMAHLGCTVVTDRSTFSSEEVAALGGGGQATFTNAIYVQFDGFIHTELSGSPSFELRWADNDAPVDPTDLMLIPAGRLQEIEPGFADAAQRITFPFHVRFFNGDPFATFPDRRSVRLEFQLGHLTCSQTIDLTHSPNPYMIDIDASANNPAWLSTDVRVFSLEVGQSKLGVTLSAGQPIAFLRDCLDELNDASNNGNALFGTLSTSAKLDLAMLGGPFSFQPIYNFAIVKVRYRATVTTAQSVKCFFRMFNVAATGLAFEPATTYRSTTPAAGAVPLLGVAGGEVASIPFFASERVETEQGQPDAASMTTQTLSPTYEVLDIVPDSSGAEVTVFFGCWLDINQTKKRFPIAPGSSDGPWPAASCRSIQELVRGEHMCLVAEVFFEPDPTNVGATPGTSDNLSQRNLAILHSDNPGGPDSHKVLHTFEVKPSELPALPGPREAQGGLLLANVAALAATKRYGVDELIFRWHDLPRGSEVKVFLSDVDTAEIQGLAALRQSPLAFEVVDRHTLKLHVAGATWVPLPGGRDLRIPALLSIQLPPDVVYGDVYRVSIHQVGGRTRRILGSCDFRIEVSKAELLVDQTTRNLSVLRHVLLTIPTDNRWYPLMQRYVHQLGVKLDALGGDATQVHPNPDGSGRPQDPDARPGEVEYPYGKPDRPGKGERFRGLVEDVLYDCHGRFRGFVLASCEARRVYEGCEGRLEMLVLRACRERSEMTVLSRGRRIRDVIAHCC